MEMVRFASQEYCLEGRIQFFAKLIKIRMFHARFVMMNVFVNLHTKEKNRICAQELIHYD